MERIDLPDGSMPSLGLGTWQLKGRECEKAVGNALEIGYRHIDTAQAYGNEERVGKAISESQVARDEIFLTTKIWRDDLEAGRVKRSARESLDRLSTNYADLILIHWPFPGMEMESVIPELGELVEEGLARNVGVSNFTTEQMERAQQLCTAELATNQVEYHPYLDQSAVLERCRELEMALTAYSPLARGEVVGDETLREIGERYGKTEVQVALRWLVQQEGVAAIPKASSRDHIEQNFQLFDFRLEEEEMERIGELGGSQRKVDPSFAPSWD